MRKNSVPSGCVWQNAPLCTVLHIPKQPKSDENELGFTFNLLFCFPGNVQVRLISTHSGRGSFRRWPVLPDWAIKNRFLALGFAVFLLPWVVCSTVSQQKCTCSYSSFTLSNFLFFWREKKTILTIWHSYVLKTY